MKKLPLVMIMFLIFIVVIVGMTDSWKHPGDKSDHHDFLSKYSSFMNTGSPDKPPFILSDDSDYPREEKLFLTNNIQKSEEMAKRLEDTVQRLEKEGTDVQELEGMLEDYILLVSESKDYLSMADNSSSSQDEHKYLDLSREKIILANTELKEIFSKIRFSLPEPLSLSENESLSASGEGIIILSGDFVIDLSISNGKLTIVDFGGDLDINSDDLYGSAIKSEQVFLPGNNTMQQMLSYNDVQGNVTLSGSVFNVAVISNALSLNARGAGEVELFGNGTYLLSNDSISKEGMWTLPI